MTCNHTSGIERRNGETICARCRIAIRPVICEACEGEGVIWTLGGSEYDCEECDGTGHHGWRDRK